MDLIGRERELAVVTTTVEADGFRVLALLGEAGIGKSALLAAAEAHARDTGRLVLRGRGARHDRDVPFGVIVDALDDHVAGMHPARVASVGEDLGAVLLAAGPAPGASGPADRVRHRNAVRSLLELLGRERPVVLLLDDLQWADAASLDLLVHLLHRPPDVPLLLGLASRVAVPRVLDAARGTGRLELLELRPLSDDAARGLVGAVPDAVLRAQLVEHAGGNPLFLRELARAVADGEPALPSTVRATIDGELADLSPAARRLLTGATTIGPAFDPELAAVAAELPVDATALDELVAAGLVRPAGAQAVDETTPVRLLTQHGGREFVFRALVRCVVYDASPPAWRLEAHERVARELERRGAAATMRAPHLARFARPGDTAAIATLREAARAEPALAADWLTAALALVPDRDRDQRAELLGELASALASAGRPDVARDAFVQALALAVDEHRVALTIACACVETQLSRHDEARRRLLAIQSTAAPEQRPAIAFELAANAFHRGDAGELVRTTDERRPRADGPCATEGGASSAAGVLAQVAEGGASLAAGVLARVAEGGALSSAAGGSARPAEGGASLAAGGPARVAEGGASSPAAGVLAQPAEGGASLAAGGPARLAEGGAPSSAAGAALLGVGADALAAIGALWTGRPEHASIALDRAAERLAQLDDDAVGARLEVCSYLALAQLLAERFAAVVITTARGLAVGGDAQTRTMLLGLRAVAHMHQLELDRALDAAGAAEAAARAVDVPHLLHFTLGIRSRVHTHRDEPAEAERAAREAAALADAVTPTVFTRTTGGFAAVAGADRDPAGATGKVTAVAGAQLEHADPTLRPMLLLHLVRAATTVDDADQLAAAATEHAARIGLPGGEARALLARAEARLMRGDAVTGRAARARPIEARLRRGDSATEYTAGARPTDARPVRGDSATEYTARARPTDARPVRGDSATEYTAGARPTDARPVRGDSAVELAERAAALAPAPLDVLDARFTLGRALAAAGRTQDAKRTLHAVAEDAARASALRLHRAAGRELRRLGSRVSSASRTRGGALSQREREVADLVAGGHSNKQIGATLFLSEKTVANTLTRVYAKLGVRSRTQLASARRG
ncbi:helix-turn-helix transcriptional regulator [Solirubrobacter phytolaccae]|uniref:helix-turn-helix transcriptional regulator n=1 Tax=Solirubrobacter phytolaccae TaxID=1404360 RepID=UPI0022CDED96|nr:AAA family ATPase [Solirubrobacter phytolaccae]